MLKHHVKTKILTVSLLLTIISVGFLGYYFGARAGYVGDVTEVWVQSPFHEASYVVGVYNSTHYYSKNGTTGEYEGLSTNASAIFNACFGNLTSGGRVFAVAGTYMITVAIEMTYDSLELVGEGESTILYLANGANDNVVEITGNDVQYCRVSDLRIDGNDGNNDAGNGIYINTPYASWDACHRLQNLRIQYTDESGIYVTGDTRVCYFSNINIRYPGERGIYLAGTDHFLNNIEVGGAGKSGYRISATASHFNQINAFSCGQDNVAQDNAGFTLVGPNAGCYCEFTGCSAADNRYNGWLLYNGVRDNTFSSCYSDDNSLATSTWDGWNITTGCYRMVFSGCISRGSHQVDGFGLDGNCELISFTGCRANGCTGDGIDLGDSENCTVTGGAWNDNGGYGIREASGANYNVIVGTVVLDNTAGGMVIVGSNTTVKNNVGFVTENSGTATNTTATTFVFNHGLAGTPIGVWASFNTTEITGWTWTATSSQITITVVGMTDDRTCYWTAIYKP